MKTKWVLCVASACLLLGFTAGWFAQLKPYPPEPVTSAPATDQITRKRPERLPDFQGVVEGLSVAGDSQGKNIGLTSLGLRVRCPPLPPHPSWPPGSRGIEVRYIVIIPSEVLDCRAGPLYVGSLASIWHTGAIGRSNPPTCTAEYAATESWASVPPDDLLQKLRPRD